MLVSITLSLSHPFSTPLWCVCLCLCHSVAGIGGPLGIDWTLLNAIRLMGDMWFTDENSARVHAASNHTHTHANTNLLAYKTAYKTAIVCTHSYLTGSKHIHKWTRITSWTKAQKQMHVCTLKRVLHTRTSARTPTHADTPLGVPPDTRSLLQLKPRGPRLRVRRAGTIQQSKSGLSWTQVTMTDCNAGLFFSTFTYFFGWKALKGSCSWWENINRA